LFREMYFAFLTSRSEKDPSTGWYEGELWFFDNYVIPLARKLKECGVFGVSSDEYLNYALQNRSEWERKGRDICQAMKARADKEAETMGMAHMDGIEEANEDEIEDILDTSIPQTIITVEEISEGDIDDVDDDVDDNDDERSTSPDNTASLTDSSSQGAREVHVPPGRLGIIIDTLDQNTTVHKVNDDSPVVGKIFPGDLVLKIDGVDMQGMSLAAITAFLSTKVNQPKIFIVRSPH
jgi:C-terminal processing protease CtpA/Prc